jgi:FkbM family methyltransferase
MRVWGAEVRPPNLDRALAAWLMNIGLMGASERRLFERSIAPGQVVVDVGANQGIFTLLFSRLVGPAGRVIALEPAPALFETLDRNCRLNAAQNVTRLQMAAGESRSQGVLHCSRFNSGDNRLTDSLNGSSLPVQIAPLDDLLPVGQVNLAKIDVQGYELRVVMGMQAILERSATITVCFEFWPSGLKYAGCTPGDLLDFFVDRGFSLFDLSGATLRKLDGHDIARSRMASGRSWRNLLATRE